MEPAEKVELPKRTGADPLDGLLSGQDDGGCILVDDGFDEFAWLLL
jgi:hypothetical protein